MARIIRFPRFPNKTRNSTKMSWWVHSPLGDRLRVMIATLLALTGIYGGVRDLQFYDPMTGQRLSITRKRAGYILSINGRDYFFSLTGRLQGTGSGI